MPAFAWEAKSQENPDGQVGATTAQQASGHADWVRHKQMVDETAEIPTFLVSDRTKLGQGADVHAGDTCIVSLDQVRELANEAVAALRRIRSQGRHGDDLALRDTIVAELSNAGLLPTQLRDRLSKQRLIDL